ncbi:MAG: hypothetical protein QXL82_03395 [Candidatus Aenigmatarchaeota archaeon]
MNTKERYVVKVEKGVYQQTGAVITLIVGVGVAILLQIFIGVLGGQAYQLTEPQIQAINNTQIRTTIFDSITSSFQALKTVGQYMPLIVLAVIIFVILGLITAFSRPVTAGGAL